MSKRFSNIKTAEELERAIMLVKAEQKASGTGITKDLRHLLDSLTPANLIKSIVPSSALTDFSLGLVQGVKKIFTVPEKPKAEKKSRKKAATPKEPELFETPV